MDNSLLELKGPFRGERQLYSFEVIEETAKSTPKAEGPEPLFSPLNPRSSCTWGQGPSPAPGTSLSPCCPAHACDWVTHFLFLKRDKCREKRPT